MRFTLRTIRQMLRADNPMGEFRSVAYPQPRPFVRAAPQLALWVSHGQGHLVPWRLHPSDTFNCTSLSCRNMTVRACVERQAASEAQKTKDTWRGEASLYPSCTDRCEQGITIRASLAPTVTVRWLGAGPGKRFARAFSAQVQTGARRRWAAAGLLEPVPTIDDIPPPPVRGSFRGRGR